MRKLTNEEIGELANMPKVRKIAVENFLSTMGTDYFTALSNWKLDARLYHWNRETIRAIYDGIRKASKT